MNMQFINSVKVITLRAVWSRSIHISGVNYLNVAFVLVDQDNNIIHVKLIAKIIIIIIIKNKNISTDVNTPSESYLTNWTFYMLNNASKTVFILKFENPHSGNAGNWITFCKINSFKKWKMDGYIHLIILFSKMI